ncbi:MAG: hypothetical protein JSV08_03000 [Acidobacteriota bacterium]|nr:MAG: hypothetical protein JSV08_03000 [Acidobacteriota bacterium]
MTLRRALELGLGWGFILLGVAGVFLPVLQGILFILVGLYFISRHSPLAAKIFEKLKARFPKLAKKMERRRRAKK